MLMQILSERASLQASVNHHFQSKLGGTDRSHAVVNTPGTETRLGQGEATAFLTEQIGYRHAHIPEDDLAVAFRRMVVHDIDIAYNVQTRRVPRHQDHALLLVPLGFRVSLAHDDENTAVRMGGVGDEPFATVDDIFVAFPPDQGGDVGGVRGRYVRLGHRESRTNFAFEQWTEPSLLLLRGAEHVQKFHVAGVRSIAVEDFGRPT